MIPINLNNIALAATKAAYKDSDQWKEALLEHLKKNHEIIKTFFKNTPEMPLTKSESTFLSLFDTSKIKNAY
jgi:bifunctional pyridoxal-dependent enzyme with beta-cystathionase and maltose regulon repressor activities